MSKQLRGNILFMITALIWGVSFVSQSVGVEMVKPNTFNGIRMLLGSVVLLPVILVNDGIKKKNGTFVSQKNNKYLWIGGVICGAVLCGATTIQTYGLVYTTAGKSAFITALYIIFVSVIGTFAGKKTGKNTIAGIVIALSGMYFLCLYGNALDINKGDVITLSCSMLFAVHIICVDYFSPKVDGIKLSCLQFFTCGVINSLIMTVTEKPSVSSVLACTLPILYSGVMSSGVAYTLQIIGQKDTDPTIASILMSFESVFAAISGWILLSQTMTKFEILGCVLMFLAIIIAQVPPGKIFFKKNQTNV